MRLLNLQIFQNKATNCQGASRVSNTALAQRARPNLQGNVGISTKITKSRETRFARQHERDDLQIKFYLKLLECTQTFCCEDDSLSISKFQNSIFTL